MDAAAWFERGGETAQPSLRTMKPCGQHGDVLEWLVSLTTHGATTSLKGLETLAQSDGEGSPTRAVGGEGEGECGDVGRSQVKAAAG